MEERWETPYLGTVFSRDHRRQCLARKDDGDLMDQRLDVTGARRLGTELAELGVNAGVFGEVDVGGKRSHCGSGWRGEEGWRIWYRRL